MKHRRLLIAIHTRQLQHARAATHSLEQLVIFVSSKDGVEVTIDDRKAFT
jgi:hypothetical protein